MFDVCLRINYLLHILPVQGNSNCDPETWSGYDSECCSAANPCGIGQGDCDEDDECYGDLQCGNNNCGDAFENSNADCCTDPTGY